MFGVLLAATMLAACSVSFSTANLSSLKLGKDKEVTTETASFGPQDTVYAVAEVSNSPGKTTVKFEFYDEKVEGEPDNLHVPGGDVSVDLPSSGTASLQVVTPTGRLGQGDLPARSAKMLNENGEQKGERKVSFTVGRVNFRAGLPSRRPTLPCSEACGDAAQPRHGTLSLVSGLLVRRRTEVRHDLVIFDDTQLFDVVHVVPFSYSTMNMKVKTTVSEQDPEEFSRAYARQWAL